MGESKTNTGTNAGVWSQEGNLVSDLAIYQGPRIWHMQ